MRPSRPVAIAVAFARTVAIAVAFAVVTAPLGVAAAHAGCAIGRMVAGGAAIAELGDSCPTLKRGVAVASVAKSLPDGGPFAASPFAHRVPHVAAAAWVASLDPAPIEHAPRFHASASPRVRGPPNALRSS